MALVRIGVPLRKVRARHDIVVKKEDQIPAGRE
jgi:hypothetical protein